MLSLQLFVEHVHLGALNLFSNKPRAFDAYSECIALLFATHAGALWLGVLNPLVLLSAVSANHNDTLMMVLLVAGLFLAVRGHPLLGIVVCVAAADIKVTALAGAAVIGVDYALHQGGWAARGRALAVLS